jgi:hypothetical protein
LVVSLGGNNASFNWKRLISVQKQAPLQSVVRHRVRKSSSPRSTYPAPQHLPHASRHQQASPTDLPILRCSSIHLNGTYHAAPRCRQPPIAGAAGRPPHLHHTAPVSYRQQSAMGVATNAVPDCSAPILPAAIDGTSASETKAEDTNALALDVAALLSHSICRSGLCRLWHLRDAQPLGPARPPPEQEDAGRSG